MSFSASQFANIALEASPSFLFNNLSSGPQSFAYIHFDDVCVLPNGLVDGTQQLKQQVLSFPEGGLTQVSWAQLARGSTGAFCVVTSRTWVAFFAVDARTGKLATAPFFRRQLGELGAATLGDRPAEAHFLRGIASLHASDIVLVGTSWGDVIGFHVGAGEMAAVRHAYTLRGAHSAPIVCIAATDECVAGVGCGWSRQLPGPCALAPRVLSCHRALTRNPPPTHTYTHVLPLCPKQPCGHV